MLQGFCQTEHKAALMFCEMGKGISNSEIQRSRGKLEGKSQAHWAEIHEGCDERTAAPSVAGQGVSIPHQKGCHYGMPGCSQCLESWTGTWHPLRPL